MKNTRMKAQVLVALCIFLMMVFASPAVFGGVNPPPGGYHWMGPSVIMDLSFRPADLETEGPETLTNCQDGGAVFWGTGSCQNNRDFDVPLTGYTSPEYFGYCQDEVFVEVTPEFLESFWVTEAYVQDLIPADCFPKDVDVTSAAVNVVIHYEILSSTERTARLILLFVHPK